MTDPKIEITDTFRLPLIPLRNIVVFPEVGAPIDVGRAKSLAAIKFAKSAENQNLAFVTQIIAEMEDPTLSSGESDPDYDGLNNLAEYFFGLNPRKTSAARPIDIADAGTSNLSFTYERSQARPDVIVRIEGSNALANWLSLTTTGMSVTPIDDTSEVVEMSVDWPFDPAYPRFLRLAIEQTDP